MKPNFVGPAAALALFIASLALAACGENRPADTTVSSPTGRYADEKAHNGESRDAHIGENVLKLSAEERKKAGVRVEAVAEGKVSETLTVTATIRPNRERYALVTPQVGGRVVKVNAALGERVRAGQALALIDSAELGDAYAALRQARSEHAVALAAFQRAEKLRTEQVIPEKGFLEAQGNLEKASAALRAAEDRLRLLGGSPKEEGAGTSVAPVLAPFAGMIVEKSAVMGEVVARDKVLFTVVDLSVAWIEAAVFERDLAKVRVGAPAVVMVAAYPEESFRGEIAYIDSVLDKETRTVKVRIEVPNRDGRLKLGMFASAAIETPGRRSGLSVPDEAVVLVQGRPTVFVEEGEGFEARTVETGERIGGRTLIASGLAPGEKVAVAGAYALKARMLKSQLGEGHAH